MTGLPCQYAIIRFLPYAETGEFANVGVVLACPTTGYLDARLMPTRKTGRITGFFDQLEIKVYREALKYLGEELERIRDMAAARVDPATVRPLFDGLIRPREALLRFSEVRVVMAEDPDAMLTKLFARFIERDFVSKQYHDQILERGVRETLRKANLRQYFKEREVGNENLHIQVPFVHLRDGNPALAIKPLDLAKSDPNQVYEVGGHWVERIRRLGKHHLLPEEMLIVVQGPNQVNRKVRAAADEILGDLRDVGVKVAQAEDTKAITEFAKAATLN